MMIFTSDHCCRLHEGLSEAGAALPSEGEIREKCGDGGNSRRQVPVSHCRLMSRRAVGRAEYNNNNNLQNGSF